MNRKKTERTGWNYYWKGKPLGKQTKYEISNKIKIKGQKDNNKKEKTRQRKRYKTSRKKSYLL